MLQMEELQEKIEKEEREVAVVEEPPDMQIYFVKQRGDFSR